MAKTIEQLEKDLFNELDGSKFSRIKDKLIKIYSDTGREKVLNIFIQYSKDGQILHWREFLLTDILRLLHEGEAVYKDFFEWTITQPDLAYWSVDGLLKTKGKEAYPALIELAQDEKQALEIRAKAIKSMAVHSKQLFDRGLPKDPGYWKTEDLRIAELLEWQQNGYQEGTGYSEPQIHAALQNPATKLEKAVSKLDKKLTSQRKQQDLSSPSNWLAIADSAKIDEISTKWKLPATYLTFLKNFSPINVFIDSDNFIQGLSLYGADELIENQAGYSFNALTGKNVDDWPANFIVIADDGADPFCIDIGNIKDNDAPIYTSEHGTGAWKFKKYANTFIDFLRTIAK
jgi:hypothetical protein